MQNRSSKHKEHKEQQRRQQQQARRIVGDADELMDTPTFRRFFNASLEGVLDAAEDFNLSDIRGRMMLSFPVFFKFNTIEWSI